MIAKISHGGSLYGVLAYNQMKVDGRHADILFGNRIIEPVGGEACTVEFLSRSFSDYLTANRKTEKPVLHISLNPDPKDMLDDGQYIALAEQYMQRMGFGDQPYVVYRHNDIGREHLHIVSVRVDETGRAISDSYEHERSMKVCRELEQQFNLTPATAKEWKEGLPLSPVDYGNGNLKGQMAGVIRPIAREWHFRTLGEYRAVLSLYGIAVDEVKGSYGDRAYHGFSYSAVDRDGNKVGKPFKSALFGKEAGIAALQKRMQVSDGWFRKHKDMPASLFGRIAAAMRDTGHDRAGFERELARQGIGVVFRENEAGRIYGVTFIDHAGKSVFNGSRLGRQFSANVFNGLYADRSDNGLSPADERTQVHAQECIPPQEDKENRQEHDIHPVSAIESLTTGLALFVPVPGGSLDDRHVPQERRRKKKRKYGRQQ